MTKKELIILVRRKTGLPQPSIQYIVDLIFATIINEVKRQREVRIQNFGTFRPSKYRNRKNMRLVSSRIVREFLEF